MNFLQLIVICIIILRCTINNLNIFYMNSIKQKNLGGGGRGCYSIIKVKCGDIEEENFSSSTNKKNAKIPWHQKYLLKCGILSASCLKICLNLKQEINEICIYSWYVYRLLSKFRNSCFTRSSTSIVYINTDREKIARYEKRKAHFGFRIKYGNFWSVSSELFVEHKLWNWKVWDGIFCVPY